MSALFSIENSVMAHIPDRVQREIVAQLRNELGATQIRAQQQVQQLSALQSENVLLRDQLVFLQDLSRTQGQELQQLRLNTQSAQSNSENEVFRVRAELLSVQERAQRVERENELLKYQLGTQQQEIVRLKSEIAQSVRPLQQIQIQELNKENFKLRAENDVLAATTSVAGGSRWHDGAEDSMTLRKRLRERIDRLESGATLMNFEGE